MATVDSILAALNAILWHDVVLFVLVATGILFTVWSGFCQYRALTHGFHVIRGAYDDPDDPGAINHFQALSAALSATVGLGNIGGVALAIALGGPGAVHFKVLKHGRPKLAGRASTHVRIRYAPKAAGVHTATVTIGSPKGDVTFAIAGEAR